MLRVDRALRSADVLAWLQSAITEHGAPEHLRSDNGSEFIAKIVQRWLKEQNIKTIHIEPGSPWQNGFVESFHGKFRDECLNREQLWTLTEARVVIGEFRREYNQLRPHSKLGYQSPSGLRQNSVHPRLRSGFALPPPGWTKPKQKTNIKPAPRLTHALAQKSEPGQLFNMNVFVERYTPELPAIACFALVFVLI